GGIRGAGGTGAIAAVAQGALRALDFGEDAVAIAGATRIDAHDGVVDLEVDARPELVAAIGRLGRTGAQVPPSAAAALYVVRPGAGGRLHAPAPPPPPGRALVGPLRLRRPGCPPRPC